MGQFKALLLKNWIVKKRTPRAALSELFMPVYFCVLLIIISLVTAKNGGNIIPAVPDFPTYALPRLADGIRLGYAPDSPAVRALVSEFRARQPQIAPLLAFNSSAALEAYYLATPQALFGGLEFNTSAAGAVLPARLRYYVRINESLATLGEFNTSGVNTIVSTVGQAYLAVKGVNKSVNVRTKEFAHGETKEESLTAQMAFYLWPIYLSFAMLPTLQYVVVGMVTEKQKRLKEGMKMMGLRDVVYYGTWLATQGATVFISVALMLIILYATSVFKYTNPFLLIVLFLLSGLNDIGAGMVIASMFISPKPAGFVAFIMKTIMVAIFYILFLVAFPDPSASPSLQFILYIGMLLPGVPFCRGLYTMASGEAAQIGVQFSNIADYGFGGFALALGFTALSTAICFFLAYYLSNVLPGEYGTSRSLCFCCERCRWHETMDLAQPLISSRGETPVGGGRPASASGRIVVDIQQLTKVYHKGRVATADDKMAVDHLDLQIAEGEICAVLGHNGAGKSTAIGALTGLFPPTSGDAWIYGRSIRTDMHTIRSRMGVCPQHDILYDMLTCREHLRMFAAIKGVPEEDISRLADEALAAVDLMEAADQRAGTCSGGQKRRLSVAMALIGNPKIVFLDEPTTGMDPESKSRVYKLIQQRKGQMAIILTSHDMDESDLLADRIAIMVNGHLKALGTSLALKTRFGVGYELHCVKTAACDVPAVVAFVSAQVPGARLCENVAAELSFVLPLDTVRLFPAFFMALDARRTALGIETYGVSMTTLEQVFLRISGDHEQQGEIGGAEVQAGAGTLLQAPSTVGGATALSLGDSQYGSFASATAMRPITPAA